MSVLNIAAYHFAPLENLEDRRRELAELTKSLQLKGTILLTPEGINMFIAGDAGGIQLLLDKVRSYPGLENLEIKESYSETQPFRRMLVKIKEEIIAFGIDGIAPRSYTSKKLPARELRQWLDEGKDVVLYDVRNDYEIEVGTFDGAVPAGLNHFRDFPEAVAALPEEMKERPIVMFCTGGIRCEKAGPFMENAGFRDIYQLEGGILKYFEECGGDHYHGDCFVFDQRVALSPALEETDAVLCYACLATVSPEKQRSPKYNPPHSCPNCYESSEVRHQKRCDQLTAKIQAACEPLPGSVPYDNIRPISIPLRLDQYKLIDALRELYSHVPLEQWEELFAEGKIVHGSDPASPDQIVRSGERYGRLFAGLVEPEVNTDIKVLYEDDFLIAVSKPAPLPMHPCGRFNRNSLEYILQSVFAPRKPRPAHRLDANTTGVVVFSKSRQVAAKLQPKFERGEVSKTYLARVLGHRTSDGKALSEGDIFVCEAPISKESQAFGGRVIDSNGLPARTQFTVKELLSDGTALLEVNPETGRTNQIRVHAWHLGIPICNDPLYLADGKLGDAQTADANAPSLQLHAWKLAFNHPVTGEPLELIANAPEWAEVEKTA
ncbi:MAG: pseudouridine synthase [Planctomycetaceae bacterium]